MDANRIGKLLAAGTSPSTVSRMFGIDHSVLSKSPEVQQAIAAAILGRTEQEVNTRDKVANLKESVVDRLQEEVSTATPGELTALLRELGKLTLVLQDGDTQDKRPVGLVSIQLNQISAPRLDISPTGEVLSLNGQSIVPATGDRLNDIIQGTRGATQESMG